LRAWGRRERVLSARRCAAFLLAFCLTEAFLDLLFFFFFWPFFKKRIFLTTVVLHAQRPDLSLS